MKDIAIADVRNFAIMGHTTNKIDLFAFKTHINHLLILLNHIKIAAFTAFKRVPSVNHKGKPCDNWRISEKSIRNSLTPTLVAQRGSPAPLPARAAS